MNNEEQRLNNDSNSTGLSVGGRGPSSETDTKIEFSTLPPVNVNMVYDGKGDTYQKQYDAVSTEAPTPVPTPTSTPTPTEAPTTVPTGTEPSTTIAITTTPTEAPTAVPTGTEPSAMQNDPRYYTTSAMQNDPRYYDTSYTDLYMNNSDSENNGINERTIAEYFAAHPNFNPNNYNSREIAAELIGDRYPAISNNSYFSGVNDLMVDSVAAYVDEYVERNRQSLYSINSLSNPYTTDELTVNPEQVQKIINKLTHIKEACVAHAIDDVTDIVNEINTVEGFSTHVGRVDASEIYYPYTEVEATIDSLIAEFTNAAELVDEYQRATPEQQLATRNHIEYLYELGYLRGIELTIDGALSYDDYDSLIATLNGNGLVGMLATFVDTNTLSDKEKRRLLFEYLQYRGIDVSGLGDIDSWTNEEIAEYIRRNISEETLGPASFEGSLLDEDYAAFAGALCVTAYIDSGIPQNEITRIISIYGLKIEDYLVKNPDASLEEAQEEVDAEFDAGAFAGGFGLTSAINEWTTGIKDKIGDYLEKVPSTDTEGPTEDTEIPTEEPVPPTTGGGGGGTSTEPPATDPETEAPTDTETPTEKPTEKPTEIPTEKPTEIPTETEAPTVTETPTELPTETEPLPTEPTPTETPTEGPAPEPTPGGQEYYGGGQEYYGEPEPAPTEAPSEITTDLDDIVLKGKKVIKTPTSTKISTPTTTTSKGNSVIPIAAGISAAAAAGLGAKAYLDRKKNNENGEDDDFGTEEWSEGDNINLEYEEPKDDEQYLDDDYAYETTEPVERYGAKTNDELADIE